MYKVIEKEILNPTVTKMVVEAPAVAKKALAGQFIILRVHEDGERIPLTIADYDREKGIVYNYYCSKSNSEIDTMPFTNTSLIISKYIRLLTEFVLR